MKIYRLLMLSIVLLFTPIQADDTCDVATPFQRLAPTETFLLRDILQKSTSPYPMLINESQKNKVQLVNFWAAWCAPCRQELPFLDKIQRDKVAAITLINVGDKQAVAEKILAALDIQYLKTRLAGGDILSTFSIMGLPASIVFDEKQVYLGMGKLKDETAIASWLSCLSQ